MCPFVKVTKWNDRQMKKKTIWKMKKKWKGVDWAEEGLKKCHFASDVLLEMSHS